MSWQVTQTITSLIYEHEYLNGSKPDLIHVPLESYKELIEELSCTQRFYEDYSTGLVIVQILGVPIEPGKSLKLFVESKLK
jgi:hypothetical protein